MRLGVGTGVLSRDLEVLGGEVIDECEGLVVGGGDEEGSLANSRALRVRAWRVRGGELGFDFQLHGSGEGRAGGDEESNYLGRAPGALGEEFGGDLAGAGGVVSQDDDFGRAGEGVDIDDAIEFFFGEVGRRCCRVRRFCRRV